MKKIISFVCIAALMLAVLSACGGEELVLMSFMPSNGNALDFGGAQVRCGGCWGYFHNEGKPGDNTLSSDRNIYKTAQIEKELNVDLYTDENIQSQSSSFYWTLYAAGNLNLDITVQHGTPNPIYEMY